MNSDKIELLQGIIEVNNQFDPKSQLWKDIMAVTGCNGKEVAGIADGLCNNISFWAGNKAAGNTNLSFRDFYDKMIRSGYSTYEGWIKVKKEIVCKDIFGFDFDPVFFYDFEDVVNPLVRLNPDCFYQMKIQNSDHYIICCIDDDGVMLIFDTGRRGVGVPAIGANRINEKYFKWLLEIPCL